MEVTKWLKPSDSVSRIGDSASVQAATRVNAEQTLYGAFEVKHLFHGILHFLHSSFFVRLGIPFLRPDPQYCKAGARRSCQGWPSPHPCGVLRALPGHTLTASSTTARLMRSGRRSEGELAHRARIIAPQPCIR